MIDSSNSSVSEGNSNSPPAPIKVKKKQISPAIKWCFTLNNWKKEELDKISSIVPVMCRFCIIGSEVGENGTPHLQGYLEFKKKKRPLSVFNFTDRIWWDKAGKKVPKKKQHLIRKWNQDYCGKEGKILFEYPVRYNLKIENWKPWQKWCLEELKTEPNERKINWVWEEVGGVGKTVFQKWYFLNGSRKSVVLSGKATDMKNGILSFFQKNDCLPEVIFINVPRSSLKYVSYTGLEEVKDMFFYSPKYEGGMICGKSPHIMIFANEPPKFKKENGKPTVSMDRWNVKYIGKKKIEKCDDEIDVGDF